MEIKVTPWNRHLTYGSSYESENPAILLHINTQNGSRKLRDTRARNRL